MTASIRRAALFGVPAMYVVVGLLHPQVNPEVGDDTTLFLTLHAVQPLLVGGLVFVVHELVRGMDHRPARIARALAVPFAIAYAVLDAMLGLSWGYVAQQATALPGADQAAAQRLLEQLLEPTGAGLLLYFGAGLLWLATVLAVVRAHLGKASTGSLWLLGSGALVFVAGHASPTGPIGMGLFLAGVIWLERDRPADPSDQTLELGHTLSQDIAEPIWHDWGDLEVTTGSTPAVSTSRSTVGTSARRSTIDRTALSQPGLRR